MKIFGLLISAAIFLVAGVWLSTPDPGAAYCRWHANMIETNIPPNVALLAKVKEVAASTESDPNNLTGYVQAHANANRTAEFVGAAQARIHADRELADYLDGRRNFWKWFCFIDALLCVGIGVLLPRVTRHLSLSIQAVAPPPFPPPDAMRSAPPPAR